MSAPDLAGIRRELGATPRTFRTVAGALRWFAEAQAGPTPLRGLPLEQGPGPRSPESRAQRDSTHAAILLALVSLQREGVQHGRLLVEWHCSWRSPEAMARDEGFPSVYSLRRAMRWTEQRVEARLRDRGLLEA